VPEGNPHEPVKQGLSRKIPWKVIQPTPTPGQDRLCRSLSPQTLFSPFLEPSKHSPSQPATPAPVLSATEKLPSTCSRCAFLRFEPITPRVTPLDRGGLVYLLPLCSSRWGVCSLLSRQPLPARQLQLLPLSPQLPPRYPAANPDTLQKYHLGRCPEGRPQPRSAFCLLSLCKGGIKSFSGTGCVMPCLYWSKRESLCHDALVTLPVPGDP